MNLIIALFGSALAGAVAHLASNFAAAAFTGIVFAFGLVFQLIYGGLVFLALKRGGLLNLPAVFLVYFVPTLFFCVNGSDTEKSLIMSIPILIWASVLAIVGWFFVSRGKSPEA
jgi:hypothetical protein